MSDPESPEEIVERVRDAHARERRLIGALAEEQIRVPSPLPGWSRAHLLAARPTFLHAALRQIDYGRAGRTTPFYRGGTDPREADRAGRDAEVEANAALPAEDLVQAVGAATAVLDDAWSRLGPADWARPARYRGRGMLLDVLFASWRESEVHMVDYDLGPRPADWSAEFCSHLLDYLARRVPKGMCLELSTPDDRRWSLGRGEPVRVRGALTDLAAWLGGRALDGRLECSTGELPLIGHAAARSVA
ncbi:maleylpyruvate isomerase family mycothiol-dependent enzyme [Streptomyces sp. NPDC005374]|uniref:maleylpyruvate isomerase family mycothiol-dependent enzyme n=1 Tax=Streptomyces sp. NPDC005374 TaxID=3364713 RepID=UPI0036A993C4